MHATRHGTRPRTSPARRCAHDPTLRDIVPAIFAPAKQSASHDHEK